MCVFCTAVHRRQTYFSNLLSTNLEIKIWYENSNCAMRQISILRKKSFIIFFVNPDTLELFVLQTWVRLIRTVYLQNLQIMLETENSRKLIKSRIKHKTWKFTAHRFEALRSHKFPTFIWTKVEQMKWNYSYLCYSWLIFFW